ncbi:sulfurtransferase [Spongiimicrobium salis]|uniref:sulfurtransferase n=1 Tax=Spongiimicrobium salis TaxID=1667022 RepID=UPI00374D7832
MSRNILLIGFPFLFFIMGCRQSHPKAGQEKLELQSYQLTPLIEAETLLQEISDPNIVLIDFREKVIYEKEHLPKAVQLWRTDIESADFPYGGMMASGKTIENLFSKLGIHNGHRLIVYDDRGSCDAARLWWVLSSYGFTKVQLLNGGIQSWKMAGGNMSTAMISRKPAKFQLPHVQQAIPLNIQKKTLRNALVKESNWVILDTRTQDEFTGKRKKNGAKKAGRIIRSRSMDWSNAVNLMGDMRFKPKQELVRIYARLIKSKSDTVIVYCHSGVRSAHTTFVLRELLGYKNVRNYDGSWVEWSHFEDYPFEQDSITRIYR